MPSPTTLVARHGRRKLFHIALHPEWPDSPYLYVTAEHEVDGTRHLRLIRVRSVDDQEPELQTLIEQLPIEQPMISDHYGSAIAFCAGYLFLSKGDTEPARVYRRLVGAKATLNPPGSIGDSLV